MRVSLALAITFSLLLSVHRGTTGAETLVNGDTNCDGHLDLSDAIFLLAHLYLGAGPPCPLADRPELLAQVEDLQGQVAQLHLDLVAKVVELTQAADRMATLERELKVWKEKVADLELKLARASLPATGQTRCYDGDFNEIDCASANFPGQDAFYLAGCPSAGRFIDNGDGTVTDKCTGLMWQKETAPGSYSWQDALKYCGELALAGHDDWRLPNVRELQSIIDYSGTIEGVFDPVFGATTHWYWSASTSPAGPGLAWSSTSYGGIGSLDKDFANLARAVRSGR